MKRRVLSICLIMLVAPFLITAQNKTSKPKQNKVFQMLLSEAPKGTKTILIVESQNPKSPVLVDGMYVIKDSKKQVKCIKIQETTPVTIHLPTAQYESLFFNENGIIVSEYSENSWSTCGGKAVRAFGGKRDNFQSSGTNSF
jgi:hypothetical protein